MPGRGGGGERRVGRGGPRGGVLVRERDRDRQGGTEDRQTVRGRIRGRKRRRGERQRK